ncbi:MAG: hypothetical protein ACREE0_22815 [Phenylobacterium sp.]
MSTQIARAQIVVLALLLTAPAMAAGRAPQPEAATTHSRIYNYSNADAWQRAVSVVGRDGMYISSADKLGGSITAQLSLVAPPRSGTVRDWADCGVVSLLERPLNQRVDMSISIQPSGRGAAVSIGAQFKELRQGANGAVRTINCASTGVLEDEMLLRLSQS